MTRRVTILAGHSGSGKTEIAVNRALKAAGEGRKIALIDLDTVNHYFRSRELLEPLKAAGVRVVLPPFGEQKVDMPLVTPEVWFVLQNKDLEVIVDVGGDATGARVIGQFAGVLGDQADTVLVYNPYRLSTATPEKAETEAMSIFTATHIPWTALLANPNVGPTTTLDEVIEGLSHADVLAGRLGVPVAAAVIRQELAAEVGQRMPGLQIEPIQLRLNRALA